MIDLTNNSFSYDGYRGNKRNDSESIQYGVKLNNDDILTCEFDMNKGNLIYYVNGKSYGIAFDNIKKSIKNGEYCFGVSLLDESDCVQIVPTTTESII